jgi:hypothetical protein
MVLGAMMLRGSGRAAGSATSKTVRPAASQRRRPSSWRT